MGNHELTMTLLLLYINPIHLAILICENKVAILHSGKNITTFVRRDMLKHIFFEITPV